MIIAIDGSAASGKGTLAKQLAKHLGLAHLDTGGLYRAVALQLLNAGQDPKNITEKQCFDSCLLLDLDLTQSPLIRSDNVAEMASIVAAIPAVRAALLNLQRQFAAQPPHGGGAFWTAAISALWCCHMPISNFLLTPPLIFARNGAPKS